MDRRDFLRMGAFAGAAAATGTTEPTAEAARPPIDMDAFLARTDAQLAGIGERHGLGTLLPPLRPDASETERAAGRRAEELLHKSMRSLLVAGILHDLTDEERAHPKLVARVRAAMPEMDEAVFGMVDLLARLSPADKIDLRDAVDEDPDLPGRVFEALDRESAELGISQRRRLHLRSIGTQIAYRMRHQSPGAVVDESVDRAERLIVHHGGNEVWRERMAAAAANEVFWTMRDFRLADPTGVVTPGAALGGFAALPKGMRVAQAAGDLPADPGVAPPPVPQVPDPMAAPPPGIYPNLQMATDANRALQAEKAEKWVTAGGAMLGVGVALTTSMTLLTVYVHFLFAFGITAGVGLLIAGIVVLAIGLNRRAKYAPQ